MSMDLLRAFRFPFTAAQIQAAIDDATSLKFVAPIGGSPDLHTGQRLPTVWIAALKAASAAASASTVTITMQPYALDEGVIGFSPAMLNAVTHKPLVCLIGSTASTPTWVIDAGAMIVTRSNPSFYVQAQVVQHAQTNANSPGPLWCPQLGLDLRKTGTGNLTAGNYELRLIGLG